MTILEAAMAGVPIVSTAVGGVPDVVRGDGLLVAPGDAALLGASLRQALVQREEALERAKALRERLERSNRENDWVGAYEALYRSLVARQR